MVTTTIRTFVQRLFTDADRRAAFLRDPRALIQAANASGEETRALFRLHDRMARPESGASGHSDSVRWP